MPIDKELYRKVRELYGQWNEAELIDGARNAGKLTPQEGWRQYVALWEFCMKLSPPQSELQQKQRLAELDHYYVQLQKLEAWRRKHGKTA